MDATDLETIEYVERFMRDNNRCLPAYLRDDKEQYALAKRLDRLLCKERKSPMLQKRLKQLTENAHITLTKAAQRGAVRRDRNRAASAFEQRLQDEHEEWCVLRFKSCGGVKSPYPGHRSTRASLPILAWTTWGVRAT